MFLLVFLLLFFSLNWRTFMCVLQVVSLTSSRWWSPATTSSRLTRISWPSWSSRTTTDSPLSPSSNPRTLTMCSRCSQTVCTCKTRTSPSKASGYMERRGKETLLHLCSFNPLSLLLVSERLLDTCLVFMCVHKKRALGFLCSHCTLLCKLHPKVHYTAGAGIRKNILPDFKICQSLWTRRHRQRKSQIGKAWSFYSLLCQNFHRQKSESWTMTNQNDAGM